MSGEKVRADRAICQHLIQQRFSTAAVPPHGVELLALIGFCARSAREGFCEGCAYRKFCRGLTAPSRSDAIRSAVARKLRARAHLPEITD